MKGIATTQNQTGYELCMDTMYLFILLLFLNVFFLLPHKFCPQLIELKKYIYENMFYNLNKNCVNVLYGLFLRGGGTEN